MKPKGSWVNKHFQEIFNRARRIANYINKKLIYKTMSQATSILRQQVEVLLESDNQLATRKAFSATNISILLIIPKYNFSKEIYHHYTFPIGLGYICSVLRKAGFKVDCLNMNHIYGDVKDILKKKLDEKDYDYVCTGGNDFIYHTVKVIIDTVHEHMSKPKFILAGHILTHEPELMLEVLRPDIGIISEGEKTIIELIEHLGQDLDIKEVAGIVFYDKDGKLVRAKKRDPIKDLDAIPFPDYKDFGFDEHLDNMHTTDGYCNHFYDYPKTYPLLGSRGCAFNCTFCWHPENYRWRSIDNIMQEIREVVKQYRINTFLIVDDCFSIKQERIYEFCKRIKELSEEVGYQIKWVCQILVHTVDKQMLETMKDAGCETISYGFESFSPIVLKSMMKPITPQQIEKAFHATLQAKIGVQGHFIFGDTAETNETARQTLSYWINNCQGQIGLGFIQPYPGSVMYQRCIEKGVIKDKLDYIKNQMDPHNCINMTENMTNEEIRQLRKDMLEEYSKHIKFVRPISMKKTNKEKYIVTVKCPFCQETITYKNCWIPKRFTYGFMMTCRECHYRFFIVSLAQKFAYKHYSKIRSLRTFYKKLFKLNKME